MKYEIHVTVEDFPSMKQANDFADFAHLHGAKALLIELYNPRNLPNVEHPLQLMLARDYDAGTEDDVAARKFACELSDMVEKAGWKVTRTKLESINLNGWASYFEAHWKLDLSLDYEWEYAELCKFLSQNPNYLRSKNLFEMGSYFLSQRVYSCSDHLAASLRFNGLGKSISWAGLPLKRVHYERVIWDSNPRLDYGWSEV